MLLTVCPGCGAVLGLQTRPAGAPADLGWQVSTTLFAHPTTNSINIVGQSIGAFVFAANMFSFVLVVRAPPSPCAASCCCRRVSPWC